MAISITLEEFLNSKSIKYDLLTHRATDTSYNSAAAAHVPSDEVSKSIVLQDEHGEFLMAVVPSNYRLALNSINRLTRKHYKLVPEKVLKTLFSDCAAGATPGIGEAYTMDMVVDDQLFEKECIYIEAGDHRSLLRVDHDQYVDLMQDASHGQISGERVGLSELSSKADADWMLSI